MKSHDLLNEELGRVTLWGDSLFINNVELTAVSKESQPLEMHQTYIDINIVLSGEETIGWKSIDAIEHITKEYDTEGDCALSDDSAVGYATMRPGDFAIVYPEDPHAPAIGDGKIRKLIAKVRI